LNAHLGLYIWASVPSRRLVAAKKLSEARFFGKVIGTHADYYVVESLHVLPERSGLLGPPMDCRGISDPPSQTQGHGPGFIFTDENPNLWHGHACETIRGYMLGSLGFSLSHRGCSDIWLLHVRQIHL